MASEGGGSGGGGGKGLDSKVYKRKSFKGLKTNLYEGNSRGLASQDFSSREGRPLDRFDTGGDDSFSLNQAQGTDPVEMEGVSGNDLARFGSLSGVPLKLAYTSDKDKRNLKRKLERELNLVRSLMKKIERNKNFNLSGDEDFSSSKLKRAQSEAPLMGISESRHLDLRGTDSYDTEKRALKAKQFYPNSDFVLGKDKSGPDLHKKSKIDGRKTGTNSAFVAQSFSTKAFKSCGTLLDRLMKHKNGWVFNSPVDVKGMGLHDYFTVIKHPMDLGSVKSRVNSNWYKSPKEFAEDVKLTFQNAMTYNPKGHDVHAMAEQLLNIFEERWTVIEREYLQEMKNSAESEAFVVPTSPSRIDHPQRSQPPPSPSTPVILGGISDVSECKTISLDPKPKNAHAVPAGRIPAPKKPKAKDLHKRDMTYDEKQKLSTSLQNLPSEKLDHVVRIIKKRNPSLCQNDDEIEVDIDIVDIETLWELDRFIMYYRKSLSKNRKNTEFPQTAVEAEPAVQGKTEAHSAMEKPNEDPPGGVSLHDQKEARLNNASDANSSSSSSGDSGSSSSGSDTEGSSV